MAGSRRRRLEGGGRNTHRRGRLVVVVESPAKAKTTLQLAAFRRLGLGVGETMAIAQRLYEDVDLGAETTGLITYRLAAKPVRATQDHAAAIRHGTRNPAPAALTLKPGPLLIARNQGCQRPTETMCHRNDLHT